jgi:biopolymer transport protein ExbD
VIAPIAPKGLESLIPQASHGPAAPVEDLVITIRSDKSLRLNHGPISAQELYGRLDRIFETSGSRIVFIRGEAGLDFRFSLNYAIMA